MKTEVKLRALEKEDLRFVHQLDNNRHIMSYWFEEPYESFGELEDLYIKHIHDNTERRFIGTNKENESIGLVELIEINYIHRNAEFQIIITPNFQGKNYARALINKALDYAFTILNLHKIYLVVSENNHKAIHLYKKSGFIEEGCLVQQFFTNGKYWDAIRMYKLQEQYLANEQTKQN
ncbi:spermidine N1-acetyltransferase [Psychromonas antarctica]|jgi:diamine N-acetyltransferase|uniref:spermidine N1-acetyltransferase n=1 Tax=Psychromonas antarctica TaxID=67573 RepID=UPI001EE8B7F7|nr:spermidine N1-acetyltransferase [Psychromonas antarctica]MCG6202734.1 spermidine N1-acetyltransferase [Psychromonas antarctica]